jgi:hypothetical protein
MTLSECSETSDNDYESEESEDEPVPIPFKKPEEDVTQWVISLPPVNTHSRGDNEAVPSLQRHLDIDPNVLHMPLPSPPAPRVPILAEDDDGPSPKAGELANAAAHQEFVQESAAYRWLLSMIQGSWRLGTPGTLNAMSNISASIAGRILSQPAARKFSSRLTPVTIELEVSLEWDLLVFIEEQQYGVSRPEDVLDRVICLTGTWSEAHAVTPLQYLEQVWRSSSTPMYELMRKFLSHEGQECDCMFFSSTSLSSSPFHLLFS